MYTPILVPVHGSDTSRSAQAETDDQRASFVSTDVAALASHMDTCRQSRGRFSPLRAGGDMLRVVVSSRIVSTGALLGAAGLGLLLYFA